MSFVGAVGFLMAGSGLDYILGMTFTGFHSLLSGKKFPQNVQSLPLVVEELLRPLLNSTDLHTMADLSQLLALEASLSKTSNYGLPVS